MTYLVDANCFITASQKTYPFDIAESFWNKIAEEAGKHRFFSIDKVWDEISAHIDALQKWCEENLPAGFFISTETEDVYKKYAEIASWAQGLDVKQSAIDKFIAADKADIYFVAFASLNPSEHTIVTEEASAPQSKTKIQLPDACSAFGIRCINFIQMLRELKTRF